MRLLCFTTTKEFIISTYSYSCCSRINVGLRGEMYITLCRRSHYLNMLRGVLYQQLQSFLSTAYRTSNTHTQGMINPAPRVWCAFVRTLFVSREQSCMQRSCPCSVSPLSPHIPKLHLSLRQPSNGRAFRCWPYRVEVKARSGICC